MLKQELHIIKNYLISYKVLALIILYIVISIILKAFTSIDITIPCLWKSLFNITCPGCGITRACTALIQLDFKSAYNYNPLVFIVVPSISFFVIRDYISFRKQSKTN